MADYKIFFKKSVTKELEKIPRHDLKRILSRIEKLKTNPRPLDAYKLSGYGQYRIRQGNYRMIYSIQDLELTVWVVRIGHRRDVYRHLN